MTKSPIPAGRPEDYLTPSDLMASLIEAIRLRDECSRRVDEYACQIDYSTRDDIADCEEHRLQGLITELVVVEEEIVAFARTLMAGGTLERCAEFLKTGCH